MRIAVLIKEVPDMEKVRFDSEKGTVDRSSADAEINPFDLNALQAAVNLKKEKEMTVTAITMGPPKAERTLRDAYARGADRCILLTDRSFGGADTWATANTLAAAIKKTGPYALILCGEKTVDGDTAQVGAEVAEILGIPHAYYVEKIDALSHREIAVTTGNICGCRQKRIMKLPALISVTKNINTIELPALKKKLEAQRIPIEKLGLSDLEEYIGADGVGIKGSPTRVLKIQVPGESKRSSRIYKENDDGFIRDIVLALRDRSVI